MKLRRYRERRVFVFVVKLFVFAVAHGRHITPAPELEVTVTGGAETYVEFTNLGRKR